MDTTSSDLAQYMARSGYEIFEPLYQPSHSLIITTWNVSPVAKMKQVIDRIGRKNVGLLVGYSKETHNSTILYKTLMEYFSLGWKVRILPNMHIKCWLIPKTETTGLAYVGSCNFAQETVVNIMEPADYDKMRKVVACYWKQASAVSKSTSLQKVRPIRQHHSQLLIEPSGPNDFYEDEDL